MRNPMGRSRRLRDGTNWRTFMRLLRLDDLMTSYTHARHITIPEKSVFRLESRFFGKWRYGGVLSVAAPNCALVVRLFRNQSQKAASKIPITSNIPAAVRVEPDRLKTSAA